jgi:hypothetical protein
MSPRGGSAQREDWERLRPWGLGGFPQMHSFSTPSPRRVSSADGQGGYEGLSFSQSQTGRGDSPGIWARRIRRASPLPSMTAEGSSREVQGRLAPTLVRSGLDVRFKCERTEKPRLFANEMKLFLRARGNLPELSCDPHRTTPEIVKLSFSLLPLLSLISH